MILFYDSRFFFYEMCIIIIIIIIILIRLNSTRPVCQQSELSMVKTVQSNSIRFAVWVWGFRGKLFSLRNVCAIHRLNCRCWHTTHKYSPNISVCRWLVISASKCGCYQTNHPCGVQAAMKEFKRQRHTRRV